LQYVVSREWDTALGELRNPSGSHACPTQATEG
jgi:hypothetical protein